MAEKVTKIEVPNSVPHIWTVLHLEILWFEILVVCTIIIIIILSFDIALFPYKHAQRRITIHCQRIDVDIHIVI